MRYRWLLPLAVLTLGSVAWGARRYAAPGFPHARHAALFPTCSGCHAGILTGDSATMYPAPTLCARCHNGHDATAITWSGPHRVATNLRFVHADHARSLSAAGDTAHCETCHAAQGTSATWMDVALPPPASCLACHAHRATAHLADDAVCATCHVPLTAAVSLPESAIAAFPQPPSHAAPDFILHHAPTAAEAQARCATCHARESCEQCHFNNPPLPAVAALGRDPRVAHLVAGLSPLYLAPASHRSTAWAYDHGAAAGADIASCANCHAQQSCRACHIGESGAGVIAKLPAPPPTSPSGVLIRAAPTALGPTALGPTALGPTALRPAAPIDSAHPMIVHVHPATFATTHGSAAATQQTSCLGCHQQRFCESCHGGRVARNFHPPNFIERHAADAYARQIDCAKCHTTESFCRSCHLNIGLALRGQHNAAFHTGQPLWLLQHGEAARRDLATCTSCHQERDCLQCHSQVGWGVDPHGPGFNARQMAARNPAICLVCHLSNPLAARAQR